MPPEDVQLWAGCGEDGHDLCQRLQRPQYSLGSLRGLPSARHPEEDADKVKPITCVIDQALSWNPLSGPDEWLPIYHCREFKWKLQEKWPEMKHWD
jgi:hypothetical protein